MPTFDFKCSACSHVFEFSRAFGSKAMPACPNCKNKKTEKIMTPPMVVFKGEGFYKTDSTKKQPSKAGAKDVPPRTENSEPVPEPKPVPDSKPQPKPKPSNDNGSKAKNHV